MNIATNIIPSNNRSAPLSEPFAPLREIILREIVLCEIMQAALRK